MNWDKITSAQKGIGVFFALVLALIFEWLFYLGGTYLICFLMEWNWSVELGTAVWIGLNMLSFAVNCPGKLDI